MLSLSESQNPNNYIKLNILTYPGSCVNLGSVPEKNPDDVRLVGASGQMQGRLASYGRLVRTCLVLDQEDDDVHAAHEAGHVQRGQARLKKIRK